MLRGSQAGVGGRKFAGCGSVDGGVRGIFELLAFSLWLLAVCFGRGLAFLCTFGRTAVVAILAGAALSAAEKQEAKGQKLMAVKALALTYTSRVTLSTGRIS